MMIPAPKTLKIAAVKRLERADQAHRIALIYGLISVAISALIAVLQYILSSKISQTGGLHNMGIRSFFSSISSFLPIIQTVILMCLNFGYLAAMVRISRGQYTSPNTLRAGMDRFWPLLRCTILRNLLYVGMLIACFYVSILVFFLSPFSNKTIELLSPLVNDSSVLNPAMIMLDEITQIALTRSLIPAFVIWGLSLLVLFLPMTYRYRMAQYVLYDHPEQGALFALRESRRIMRNNRLPLFRLDLSFWWYFLLLVLIGLIGYLDVLLSLIGIEVALSETVIYFGLYFLSLAAELLLIYFLKNRISTAYAAAYNAIRPEENNNGGVVLGNIFQM